MTGVELESFAWYDPTNDTIKVRVRIPGKEKIGCILQLTEECLKRTFEGTEYVRVDNFTTKIDPEFKAEPIKEPTRWDSIVDE